ncbi:MAG: hypothetical protein MHPSP_000711, partial [Paramarteilia canceri]
MQNERVQKYIRLNVALQNEHTCCTIDDKNYFLTTNLRTKINEDYKKVDNKNCEKYEPKTKDIKTNQIYYLNHQKDLKIKDSFKTITGRPCVLLGYKCLILSEELCNNLFGTFIDTADYCTQIDPKNIIEGYFYSMKPILNQIIRKFMQIFITRGFGDIGGFIALMGLYSGIASSFHCRSRETTKSGRRMCSACICGLIEIIIGILMAGLILFVSDYGHIIAVASCFFLGLAASMAFIVESPLISIATGVFHIVFCFSIIEYLDLTHSYLEQPLFIPLGKYRKYIQLGETLGHNNVLFLQSTNYQTPYNYKRLEKIYNTQI